MTKSELIISAAGIMDIPLQAAGKIVDGIFDTIIDAICNGDTVTIPGFGFFSRKQRDAAIRRNPHTGERIEVPAHGAPVFKPGKKVKEAAR